VAKDKIEEQRARQNKTASQRVQTETRTEAAAEQRMQPNATQKAEVTTTPTFEYSNDAPATNAPVITQDKDDEEDKPPATSYARKLRSQTTQSMTDEWLYSMMEFPGITTTVNPQMAASRKYPIQFLCNYANAVIDNKTGEIMEYQHLLKDPKHRERWQRSFRKEYGDWQQ
jgi:hypothetical protein